MGDDSNRTDFIGKVTQKAILFRPDGDILLTASDGTWQPPGGTFEYGETLIGGLRRELQEELDLDARVGPPVEAMYGGWIDETTYDPMVTLLYRCETDDRAVTLNDEHDEYAWLTPAAAIDRLEAKRLRTAVERATALDGAEPFEAVTDPYEDTAIDTEAVLAELAEIRETDPGERSN